MSRAPDALHISSTGMSDRGNPARELRTALHVLTAWDRMVAEGAFAASERHA